MGFCYGWKPLQVAIKITRRRLSSIVSSEAREQCLLGLFKSCSTMTDLKQAHAQIIKTGFHQNIYVVGRVVSFCMVSDVGCIDYAVSVFRRIDHPDVFLWNTMIRGFGKIGLAKEAFVCYTRMVESGKVADSFTFSFLLKICGQVVAVELGKQVHCCTLKHGLESHLYVRNTLIHMYGLLKELGTARYLFDEMSDKDLVSWNTIIDGHVHCRDHRGALRLFLRMQMLGLSPDDATVVAVLSACSELGALGFGRWTHHNIRGSGIDQIASVSNSLIDMYAKCGAIDKAFEVFEGMGDEKNVVSWNSMISGLALHGRSREAINLFSRMQHQGIPEPDSVTFLGVLRACSHGGLVEQGKAYFEIMKDSSVSPTLMHYGCMVDLLGRAGLVREAYELVVGMPMKSNAIVWRTLLAACYVHEDLELGKRVRSQLLELEPDHSGDFVLLSNIYASAGNWKNVLIEREAMRHRGIQKREPGNSLIGTRCE